MRNRLDDHEMERLKLNTKVVADAARYHARTPRDEAWCGCPPFEVYRVLSLLEAEDDSELDPCYVCFDLPAEAVGSQEQLQYG